MQACRQQYMYRRARLTAIKTSKLRFRIYNINFPLLFYLMEKDIFTAMCCFARRRNVLKQAEFIE